MLDIGLVQQGLFIESHAPVILSSNVVRAFAFVAQRPVLTVVSVKGFGAALPHIGCEHILELVRGHEEMADPVIVLAKETLIEQTGEIAARTRIRHVVTLRVDAVGEFRIAV